MPTISRASITQVFPPNEAVIISVDVKNTGSVAGDEVVQLYLTHPGVSGAPLRALQGIARIHLERGEKKTVKFVLRDRDLSIVDESGKHRIVPGKVDAWIGGGQPVATASLAKPAGATTQFTITRRSHSAGLIRCSALWPRLAAERKT